MITGTTLSKYIVNADGSLSAGIALSGLTEPLAVAVSPLEPNHLIAVDEKGQVYASRDGGRTWPGN